MKKKFVKAMLFGALTLSVSTSLTSCSDYDDDVQNLQQQIDEVKASVSDLQTKVGNGNWVKSVESVTGGFKLTFNDGQVYTIVNGADGADGADGTDGVTPVLTVEDGYWCINGEKTDWPAQGEKGEKGDKGEDGTPGTGTPGADGKSPYIGEDGHWYWYSDEQDKWMQGDAAESSMYIVKDTNKPSWTLHVYNKETAGWEDVVLPSADAISEIKVVGITNGRVYTPGNEIYLYYGSRATPVQFGPAGEEKTYGGNGKILISNSAKIHALINPADVDFSEYAIGLQNSKGESIYKITKVEKNMSEAALSRAATENQGLYDLTIGFVNSEVNVPSNLEAYALSTQDAFGRKILSAYDARIRPVYLETILNSPSPVNVQFGQDNVLSDLVKEACGNEAIDRMADYYFTLPSGASDVTIKKNEAGQYVINSSKGQSVNVTVHYLTVMGNEYSTTMRINFVELVTVGEISWLVNGTNSSVTSVFDEKAQSLLNSGGISCSSNITTSTEGKHYVPGSISLSVVKNTSTNKWELKADFDALTVAATAEYQAVIEFQKNGAVIARAIATIKVGMNNDDLFVYFPLDAYFNGDDAIAYGTPISSNREVRYNLFDLFGKNVNGAYQQISTAERAYFEFEEKTFNWLSTSANGSIFVPYAEVYKSEAFTVNYYPFNNRNLDPITKTFNLTVKSEIKESREKGTVNGKFISLSNKNFDLKATDFVWKDAYNQAITWNSDSRVVSMKLKLNEAATPYLELNNNGEIKNASGVQTVTVSLKNDITVISNDVLDSALTLEVTDTWGQKTIVNVAVPIKK